MTTRVSTWMMSQLSLIAMLDQQAKTSKTQLQLSTGQRLLAASDDPTSAARVLDLNSSVETLNQYIDNANRAQARLESEEGVLIGVTNMLQRANELTIQGNNETLTETDARAVASEIRQLQKELLSLANSRDSNGEYMFSGYKTNTRPINISAAGAFSYAGDLGRRQLQIAPERFVIDGDNGYNLFMDVNTGLAASVNGVAATAFTAVAGGDIVIDGGNGNGPVSLGPLPAAADAAERAAQLRNAINVVSDITDVYVEFATTSTLNLKVVGNTGGLTIGLAGSATTATTGLTAGNTPSTTGKRSIFETFELLASGLERHERLDQYIEDIQLSIDRVIDVRTTVGARLNAIDEQQEINMDLELVLETHRSEERDLDYTEAVTRLERQMIALQAAQQAYTKVQGLSLFNYIR